MASIHHKLTEIFETKEFEKLEPYKKPKVWRDFSQQEKKLFSKLLLMQGAKQLSQGDPRVLESFDMANQISSDDSEILFEQGVILSQNEENIRYLILASQVLAKALEIDSMQFKCWNLRGQVLTGIGIFEGDGSFFIEANQCYEKAESLLNEGQTFLDQKKFYWKWASCLLSFSKVTGEPLDFFHALAKFRKAKELGCSESHFFNELGLCLAEIGNLLEKKEYYVEASDYFRQATVLYPQEFEGWFNQACCHQSLSYLNNDRKSLALANDSFAKAAEINSNHSQLWLKWGQLIATLAKLEQDKQKMTLALKHFSKAQELDPNDPEIMSFWAEIELFFGIQEESLEMIQSACKRIRNALEIQSDNPTSWYVYGSALNALGSYFNIESFHYEAIKKFKQGLSLTRNFPLFWYGLATVYFDLGTLKDDETYLEKSISYYARVFVDDGEGYPKFWNDWGVALLKLGEMSQQITYIELAAEKFKKALETSAQNMERDFEIEWGYNYGCALEILGEMKEEPDYIEKAIHILSYVVELNPDNYLAQYHLAIAYSHLGEITSELESYERSIDHFQNLVQIDAEDELLHLDFATTLIDLALLIYDFHHQEKFGCLCQQAEFHLTQAIALGNTQAYYQLAGLYSILEKYDQAIHFLERAKICGNLPPVDDLYHDDWLENLRQTHAFRRFIGHDDNDRTIER